MDTAMSEEGYLKRKNDIFTKATHGGFDPEQESTWPLVPSIAVTTSFEQIEPGEHRASLGATTAIASILSAGDHIIAGDEMYGGTARLFKEVFGKFKVETTIVDTRDTKNIENAIKSNTKLVWVETPTNPLLKVVDIAKVADIVHKHKDIILVVDNSFMTPYFQQPLNLGADVSMHSLSKYMNGHIDVVMGAISTNDFDLYEKLRYNQHAMGLSPSPFDCYQVNRSLKTLPLRMEHHMKSSIALAKFLEKQPKIEKVIHPGLPSHPQHDLMKKQCFGTSGMISFYIKGGLKETKLFIKSLKLIKFAPSFGGYTTTLLVPSLMTHTTLPEKVKLEYGITDNLIRMTVGFESVDDLIADVSQALEIIK
ncbi:Cystathionine gamma-lyase [Gryllus bimaculatus]|nr:Cystathionine gamma-lyase [Gryllus bimaculatus]